MLPAARLIVELPKDKRSKLLDLYKKNIYRGCGKSLACHKVCPKELNINRLLTLSNKAAIMNSIMRRKRSDTKKSDNQ